MLRLNLILIFPPVSQDCSQFSDTEVISRLTEKDQEISRLKEEIKEAQHTIGVWEKRSLLEETPQVPISSAVPTAVLPSQFAPSVAATPVHTSDTTAVSVKQKGKRKALEERLTPAQKESHEECLILIKEHPTTNPGKLVSSHGVYCAQLDNAQLDVQVPDGILKYVIAKDEDLLDFGSGVGLYVRYLKKHGIDALGMEGQEGVELVSHGAVLQMDLVEPIPDDEQRDWVFSTEVLEHIPKDAEKGFISNVNRMAAIGVIISCGSVGQWGNHHVNTKEPEEVMKLMEKNGLHLDRAGTELLRRNNIMAHYLATNMLVFRRVLPAVTAEPEQVLGVEDLVCGHKDDTQKLTALMDDSKSPKWSKFFQARSRCFIPNKWSPDGSCGCQDFFDMVCDGLKNGIVPDTVVDAGLAQNLHMKMGCHHAERSAQDNAFHAAFKSGTITYNSHNCWERTYHMCPSDTPEAINNKIMKDQVAIENLLSP